MSTQIAESELTPKPVEELFKNSPNDALRNIALRILYAKKEAKHNFMSGALGMLGSPMMIGLGGISLTTVRDWGDALRGVLGVSMIVLGSGVGYRSLNKFASSAQLGGEANSLTTVLAAEAIAQSKQNPVP